MSKIEYQAIGIIHTSFTEKKNTPIQPIYTPESRGTVELFPEYAVGLQDIEGFSHLILIYHFDRMESCSLLVKPFLDGQTRGVFATRYCGRPNAIGISIVRLEAVRDTVLEIASVDILDGTPLLDIKPYVEEFDIRQGGRQGWYLKASDREECRQRGYTAGV